MHYSNLTGNLLEKRPRASHKFPVTDKKGKHGLYSQSRHTKQHLQEEQRCSVQLCNIRRRSILGFTKWESGSRFISALIGALSLEEYKGPGLDRVYFLCLTIYMKTTKSLSLSLQPLTLDNIHYSNITSYIMLHELRFFSSISVMTLRSSSHLYFAYLYIGFLDTTLVAYRLNFELRFSPG